METSHNIVCSGTIRNISREGFWIVAGQIVSMVASLVLVRVLTEYLDPKQYGQLALAMTLGTLIGQVAFAGVMPGIMRYYSIAVEKRMLREYFRAARRMMGYGTLVALILGGLLLLGLSLLGKKDMLTLTGMSIIFILLANYNTTQSMIQNAARQRKVVVLHGFMDSWMRVIFVLFLSSWIGASVGVVVAAYIASLLVVLLSQSFFINRMMPRGKANRGELRQWIFEIWEYSKPFVLINLFSWIQASSDRWALEELATRQDVGFYAVLLQLGYTPISIVAGMMVTLIGPILFQRSGDATDSLRNAGVHKLTWLITGISVLFTVTCFLFACLFHGWIFSLLVADQYRSISYLLPWMILAGGFFSSGQMLSLKLMSELNTRSLTYPKVVTSVLGAFLSFGGAYCAGVGGVVGGVVIFSVAQLIWLGWLTWRRPIGIEEREVCECL